MSMDIYFTVCSSSSVLKCVVVTSVLLDLLSTVWNVNAFTGLYFEILCTLFFCPVTFITVILYQQFKRVVLYLCRVHSEAAHLRLSSRHHLLRRQHLLGGGFTLSEGCRKHADNVFRVLCNNRILTRLSKQVDYFWVCMSQDSHYNCVFTVIQLFPKMANIII